MTSVFRKKPIVSAQTLGDRLRELREERGATVEDVVAATEVPVKYLEAIETGRYADFPGEVYLESYLKRYAKFLELNEETILRRYADERRAFRTLPSAKRAPGPAVRPTERQLVIEPKLLRRAAILLMILGVLVYLGLEVRRVTNSPKLIIDQPPEGLTVSEERLTIKGNTDRETRVLLNGSEISVDRNGNFEEAIDLRPGLNTLRLTAVKKNGKERTVSRSVSYKAPE